VIPQISGASQISEMLFQTSGTSGRAPGPGTVTERTVRSLFHPHTHQARPVGCRTNHVLQRTNAEPLPLERMVIFSLA